MVSGKGQDEDDQVFSVCDIGTLVNELPTDPEIASTQVINVWVHEKPPVLKEES